MKKHLLIGSIKLSLILYLALYKIIAFHNRNASKLNKNSYKILLTGTFFSSNWLAAHISPLMLSKKCKEVVIVTSYDFKPMEKIKIVHPNRILCKFLGVVPARMITFIWYAIKYRPDIVGGFHLLFNGMLAAIIAKIIGAYSLYLCVGGPAEVQNGGIKSENRIFTRIQTPNLRIEELLIKTVSNFDIIVTMGNGAIAYFKDKGIHAKMCMIQGGLDAKKFKPNYSYKEYDIIFVGRLVPIKQLHILLEVIKKIKLTEPNIKALIIGDGPLRNSLQNEAEKKDLGNNIIFLGQRKNVEEWFNKSKVFVLTSETEGLSLAMMEAIACGLPVVVPKVGDLEDMVEDHLNGYLINEHSIEEYVERIKTILENTDLYKSLSDSAVALAEQNSCMAISQKWSNLLTCL